MMSARLVWVLMSLASAIGALPACRCIDQEAALASIDGPIVAEWVYTRTFESGGKLGRAERADTLEIQKPQRVSVAVDRSDCDPRAELGKKLEPQLAAASSGTELAYRCGPGKPWRVVYLSPKAARAFDYCNPELGSGDEPDWSRLADFATAKGALMSCIVAADEHAIERQLWPLLTEVKERLGDHALADLLLEQRAAPLPPKEADEAARDPIVDDWDQALRSLPKAEQQRVMAALRDDLKSAGSHEAALSRALWWVEDPSAELLLRQAQELAAKPDWTLTAVILARLVSSKPQQAGGVACDLAARIPQSGSIPVGDQTTILAVLAATHTDCPAVAEQLSQRPDDSGYDCEQQDGSFGLCTTAQLAGAVNERVSAAATERRFDPHQSSLTPLKALLAAGRALPQLPQAVLDKAGPRAEHRHACRTLSRWLERSTKALRTVYSSEQWASAKPGEPRAMLLRQRAQAYRAASQEPLQGESDATRAFEQRIHAYRAEHGKALERRADAEAKGAAEEAQAASSKEIAAQSQRTKIVQELQRACAPESFGF